LLIVSVENKFGQTYGIWTVLPILSEQTIRAAKLCSPEFHRILSNRQMKVLAKFPHPSSQVWIVGGARAARTFSSIPQQIGLPNRQRRAEKRYNFQVLLQSTEMLKWFMFL
jgi:hypothetical protein